MNFLAMCQKLRRDIGVQGSGPSSVVGQVGNFQRIVDYVADADEEIQKLFEDWEFLRTTVSFNTSVGTANYTLAALGITAHAKWDIETFAFKPNTTSFRMLTEMRYHDFKNSAARYGTGENNEPTQVVLHSNGSFTLTPTPDASYAIKADYWAAPTRLAANTDESAIPSQFHQMIIELATKKYGVYDENDALIVSGHDQYENVWLPRLQSAQLRGYEKNYSSHDPNFTISSGEHA